MKKGLLAVVAFLSLASFALPASAAEVSVITPAEQSVISAAQAAAGSHMTSDYLNQANNYFKTVDLSDADAAAAVSDINEVVALVKSAGVDTANVKTLDDLLALLPADVASKVSALAADIQAKVGVSIAQILAGTWSNGSATTGRGTTKPGAILANTGANYATSGIALLGLVTVAAGAAFVSKKQENA
ncbi:MAG: hypothetical protein LBM95_01085 [Lactobacillales bacterium]|jgi:hypothetical protein|nr:hypothetical protein [Lactobacillales bacterium]